MMSEQNVRIEIATLDELAQLTDLVTDLMDLQDDFEANAVLHERGLRLILEDPSRGRIFVIRNDYQILGMVNTLFTVSTALGGFVILMEDFVIHPEHRGHNYGTKLLDYLIKFAEDRDFKRITLLADKLSADSQKFFKNNAFKYSSLTPMRLILTTTNDYD